MLRINKGLLRKCDMQLEGYLYRSYFLYLPA